MIKLAENGRAMPLYSPLSEQDPYYNPNLNHYDFNPDKARQLLKEAGYHWEESSLLGKDGQPLKFTLSFPSAGTSAKPAAILIQSQLKALEIEVSLNGIDSQAFTSNLAARKFEAALWLVGGTSFPDLDSIKNLVTKQGLFNSAGLVIPRLDEIFEQAGHELDLTKRKQLYGEARQILNNELPMAIFYSVTSYLAANKKVGGIVASKASRIDYNYALTSWYFSQ